MVSTSPRDLVVSTVVPVSDLEGSRAFYEQTLGLAGEPAPGGHVVHAGGGTRIYLLPGTGYAGRAEWPLASLLTDDLRATVTELRERGVAMETDGTPIPVDEQGVADAGAMLIAWFRDPDGQVLSIVQPTEPSTAGDLEGAPQR